MAISNLYGTNSGDLLDGAGVDDTLNAAAGDDVIQQESLNNRGRIAMIDGGSGRDTVEVVLSDTADTGDAIPDYAVSEIDPVLNLGYTHQLTHLTSSASGALGNEGQTLLRDVEILGAPDGTSATLGTGGLDWHAETTAQSLDIASGSAAQFENNLLGRTVATLAGGTIVRVYQSAESTSVDRLGFHIFDGDGTLTFESDLFGQGSRQTQNPYADVRTSGAQITALDDGGFAITYSERSTTDSTPVQSDYFNQLKVQLFNADGSMRGEPILIVDDPNGGGYVNVYGFTTTTMENGRLLVSYKSYEGGSYYLTDYTLNPDGSEINSTRVEPGSFPQFHGSIALPDGFVSIFLDEARDDLTGDQIEFLIARKFIVDDETGAITASGPYEALYQLDQDDSISWIDYVSLGDGNFAAAFTFSDREETILLTSVDGVIRSENPLPGEYTAYNNGISLTAAPGGGAYLVREVIDNGNVDGAVFGNFVMVIPIAADGTTGTPFNASNSVDLSGNHSRPVVAVTDDGLIAFWGDSTGSLTWVSYQDADAYDTEIIGEATADNIAGTSGDDNILALGGDDTVRQSKGIDRFDGGTGVDTFSAEGAGAHILSLDGGYVSTQGSIQREGLIGFENLKGSDEGDILIGDREANLLDAGGGDDTITGLGGEDTIRGGAGNDVYLASADGINYLDLGASASVERIDLSAGLLQGTDDGVFFDLSGVASYAAFAAIEGGIGQDTITGTATADNISGGSENDFLSGDGGNDTLAGERGNDTLNGGAGDDMLTGGTGSSSGNTFVFDLNFGNDTVTDYQRLRDTLDFSAFSQAQLEQITVSQNGTDRVATFHDGSTLTLENTARNYAPSGSLEIVGIAQEYETLSVGLSGITDTDGFSSDGSYQWLRDGTEITGATANTYTLGQEDVGTQLSVVYSYTDLFQSVETVSRRFSDRILNVNDLPQGAVTVSGELRENQTLSAQTATLTDRDGLGDFDYQWLRDGAEITGAEDATYLLADADIGTQITVRVSYTDGEHTAETVTSTSSGLVENLNDLPEGALVINGTAREGAQLMAVTDGITDADGLSDFAFMWLRDGQQITGATDAFYDLTQADVGAQITLRVDYVDGYGTAENLISAATGVVANVNNTPEGAVSILGRTLVNDVLTADAALTDEDGLGPLGYQWLRDGSNIADATDRSYQLQQADVGAAIAVQVSYTDAQGTAESMTSATSAAVTGRAQVGGTDSPEEIKGTEADETIYGAGGNDTINGGGGSDELFGNESNDFLYTDGVKLSYMPDVAAQVYRLYQATLDRAPDMGGHIGWAQRIAEGSHTVLEVAQGFVNSPEFRATYGSLDDGAFINLLYQNVLNRDADAGGLAGWQAALASGDTRAKVVLGFANSQEFINATQSAAQEQAAAYTDSVWGDDIYRLYLATLAREPDVNGFLNWAELLGEGMDFNAAVTGFVRSKEFQATYGTLDDAAFVELLYNNVLGRDADAAGLARWTADLASGVSRETVVSGFSQSAEFRQSTKDSLETWVRAQGTDDVLNGGRGENVLTGGMLNDVFVFERSNGGTHTVLDLEAWDSVDLSTFGYRNEEAARDHLNQSGSDVIFADQGVTVTFQNVSLAVFDDDMILV